MKRSNEFRQRLLTRGGFRYVVSGVMVAVLCAAAALAGPVKLEDPLMSPGWIHFYNNEYDQAVALFDRDTQERPRDPNCWNHLAQAVLYRELYRNGALESQLVTGNNPFLRRAKLNIDPRECDRFTSAVARSIELATAMLGQEGRDAEALYALSVAHGLRANYFFLVEKNWTGSLRDAAQSRKYSDQLLKVDAKLTDAYLVQGLHDYVVGSLPLYMRMLGFVAGFHGDRDKGIRELRDVAEHGVLNRYDALILLAVIYRRERRPADAVPLLSELIRLFPRNALMRLEQAQMYADLGNRKAALDILYQVDALRIAGAPGFKDLRPGKLSYFKGNLLFWFGDLHPALVNLKAATQDVNRLDLNTALLAWLRVGQVNDLLGDREEATRAYQQVVLTARESPVAREAEKYIAEPYRRHKSNE